MGQKRGEAAAAVEGRRDSVVRSLRGYGHLQDVGPYEDPLWHEAYYRSEVSVAEEWLLQETPSHLHRRAGRRTHFHGASAVESPGPILVATPFRESTGTIPGVVPFRESTGTIPGAVLFRESTALYQGGREEPERSVEEQQRRLEAEGAAVCEECGNFEHVYGEFPWTDPLFKEAYFGQERSHVRNGSNSPKADSPSTPTSSRSRPEVGASPAGSQGMSLTAPSKRRRNSPEGKGGHSRSISSASATTAGVASAATTIPGNMG
ncbi:UNVERIFIED_CONTAM: hypothetical protein FKN15_039990 [Acipenser sinensis]